MFEQLLVAVDGRHTLVQPAAGDSATCSWPRCRASTCGLLRNQCCQSTESDNGVSVERWEHDD